MDISGLPDAERQRLAADAARTANWKRWGPYVSDRQWGTVREDYSPDGTCWDYVPHDHARSRAYRWGEDGLAGVCDRFGFLNLAVAMWNGHDDRLKERLSDPVADRLIESLRIAREVGGSDLGRLLRTLSAFLREDARTRAELETRQGWTVNAARLAVAAPWIVLAMLSTRPDSLQAYSRPAGVLVLAVGAGLTLVAYRLMVRIGRLPEEGRVLR